MVKTNVKNGVIGTIFVGEHVKDLASNLAKWLTQKLNSDFANIDKIWKLFETADTEEELPHGFPDCEECFESCAFEGSLAKFYRKAYKNGATRIIIFNNNAYIDLVAIAGNPTPCQIAVAVLGKENVRGWSDDDTQFYLGDQLNVN